MSEAETHQETVAAGKERPSERREKRREIERERNAKLMQLLSRTNVFGAAEYRSHISSDCLLASDEAASCSVPTESCIMWTTMRGR